MKPAWVKEGTPYWENEDCPREYLMHSLQHLILLVEDVHVDKDHFYNLSDEKLRDEVARYEHLADK